MMKKITLLVSCLLSTIFISTTANSGPGLLALFISPTHGNCPQALPTADAGFCASFKSVAQCHCTSSGLPAGMCRDMNSIYSRMVSIFGSQQKACEYQKDTTTQTCMDDWNCYRMGGKDSLGRLCSSNGNRC